MIVYHKTLMCDKIYMNAFVLTKSVCIHRSKILKILVSAQLYVRGMKKINETGRYLP